MCLNLAIFISLFVLPKSCVFTSCATSALLCLLDVVAVVVSDKEKRWKLFWSIERLIILLFTGIIGVNHYFTKSIP